MKTSGFQSSTRWRNVLRRLQQTGQVGQHFGQAHHRQFARIEPGVHAGRAHRIAADAGEFRIGEMRA
jgi:hypothetical protein